MSIKRAKHTVNYTVLTNDLINDGQLDWQDLGLLVYLLSKPENWTIRVSELVKKRRSGRSKIYSILGKLQALGYASFKKHSSGKVDWTIYDEPHVEKPDVEKPDLEKQHVLVSTDLLQSTEKDNNPPIVPQGDVIPFEKITKLYHEILNNNPKLVVLTDKRKKQIKKIWLYDKQHQNLQWWKEFFEYCNMSAFLTNQITSETHQTFRVDFEWITNFNNFTKIIEEKYHR